MPENQNDPPETTPPAPSPATVTPVPAAATGATDSRQPPAEKFNVNDVARRLVDQRGGDFDAAMSIVKKLLWDNEKGRVKVRDLKMRIASDGDVILKPGPALDEYNRLRALGADATEIKKKLDEHTVLQGEVKATKQQQFFRDVAESMGIPNHKAFAKLAEKFGIEIVIKDVVATDDDGKKVTTKLPYARLATDTKAELRPLDVYLDEELGEFHSALYDSATEEDGGSTTGGSGSNRPHAPEPRKGTLMTPQSGSGRPPAPASTTGAVQDVVNSRYRHLKPAARKP